MRIAGVIQDSIVDGPGLRFTVFTQGCPHHCEGCHNPETHDANGGKEVEPSDIIAQMLSNPFTDGLTLSGGEPFSQASDCFTIAEEAHKHKLNVWTYSGYTFEALLELSKNNADIASLLKETDILVDGPFILSQRTLALNWRGSRNQRIIDVRKSFETHTTVKFMD